MAKNKDENSWRYGGIKRRDFRNGGVDEEDFAAEFRYHKKKRRNPCEAEGRQHTMIVKRAWTWVNYSYELLVCNRCGKHIHNTTRNGPVNPE